MKLLVVFIRSCQDTGTGTGSTIYRNVLLVLFVTWADNYEFGWGQHQIYTSISIYTPAVGWRDFGGGMAYYYYSLNLTQMRIPAPVKAHWLLTSSHRAPAGPEGYSGPDPVGGVTLRLRFSGRRGSNT